MLRFLFDTDHVTLYQHAHSLIVQRFMASPPGSVGISAVSVEEVLRGRLAMLARPLSGSGRIQAYARLVASVQLFWQFPIIAFDQGSETLFQQFRTSRIRVGTQDLKIAAVALANNLTLLTRNRVDFGRVPGLLLDDWSV
jgi:tRNA(fMet)-specific endonuclease VapC